jgi:hypothetical protein
MPTHLKPPRHVLILTYGRSGSTLLQGLLNRSQTVHVAGENGDFVYHLFKAHQVIEATKTQVGRDPSRTPRHPFFGIDAIDQERLRIDLARAVERQIVASCPAGKRPHTVGYKEIRYPYKEDLEEYLHFLDILLSDCAFLFLFRNLERVLQSGMFANLSEPQRDNLRGIFLRFEDTATTFSIDHPRATVLEYEDFTRNPFKILGQLSEVGLSYDLNDLEEVLELPHSYTWSNDNISSKS